MCIVNKNLYHDCNDAKVGGVVGESFFVTIKIYRTATLIVIPYSWDKCGRAYIEGWGTLSRRQSHCIGL